MDSEYVTIPLSKKRICLMALGAGVFVLMGLWLCFGEIAGQKRGMARWVGGAAIAFFGAASVFLGRKIFDQRPGLILTREGMSDQSSALAAGFVPWAEITDLTITRVRQQSFLTVHVIDPTRYVERGSFLVRLAKRANARFYRSPIQISAHALKCDFQTLAATIQDFWDRFRDTATSPPSTS